MSTDLQKKSEDCINIEPGLACPSGSGIFQLNTAKSELQPEQPPELKKCLGPRPRVGNADREILKIRFDEWK